MYLGPVLLGNPAPSWIHYGAEAPAFYLFPSPPARLLFYCCQQEPLRRREEWSQELRTRSHKKNLLDSLTISPYYFYRKRIRATYENLNFDLRVFNQGTSTCTWSNFTTSTGADDVDVVDPSPRSLHARSALGLKVLISNCVPSAL